MGQNLAINREVNPAGGSRRHTVFYNFYNNATRKAGYVKNVTGKAGVDTGKAVDFQRDDCGVILYIRCAVTEFTLLVHKCLVSVLSM